MPQRLAGWGFLPCGRGRRHWRRTWPSVVSAAKKRFPRWGRRLACPTGFGNHFSESLSMSKAMRSQSMASERLTRRRFVQGVACAAGLTLGDTLGGAEPGRGLPPVSWWPEWRHDGHRSGCSHLVGAIKRPAEHWRYFLGAPPTARVDNLTRKPAP